MLDIFIAEGHPETDTLDFRQVRFQAFDFLMIHEVHVLGADGLKIELLLHRHGWGFNPVAIFPMAGNRSHFANVDFRVEIGGKGLAMVAAIAIKNVECVDPIKMMLFEVGGEHAGHARVKTRPQQRHDPGVLETVLIGPLPVIFELGFVLGLIIGSVEIVGLGRKARVHDRQILIGQR